MQVPHPAVFVGLERRHRVSLCHPCQVKKPERVIDPLSSFLFYCTSNLCTHAFFSLYGIDRTFVVFRFWINNHFADDFLTSKSLRFQMASFLNEMRFNTRVQESPRDSRIIRNLMDFFKYQRRYYKGLAQQSATTDMERYHQQHMFMNDSGQVSDHGDVRKPSTDGTADSEVKATAEATVDRLRVSIVHRQVDPATGKVTTSDVTETANAVPNPTKGRHRAYTLGGMITSKSANSDALSKHAVSLLLIFF
jgi:hypothetical protein